MDDTPPGRVVLLNGTSSAGKTTLALALQDLLPEPWQYMALDQFRDGLPGRCRGLNAPAGSAGADGLNVVPVAGRTEIRFGMAGQRMLRGMRRAVAAMAHTGTPVLVDDLLMEQAFLADYVEALAGLDVLLVAVRCSPAVAAAREAARPGRFPGTTESLAERVYSHCQHDLEVDTGVADPVTCARAVADRLAAGPGRVFPALRG